MGRHDIEHELGLHRRELTGFCYRMLGSGSEAEDAVQETLVRAWRGADTFEGRSSVKSWLYRIAGNVCIDMLRGPQRRSRPMDLGPSSTVESAVLREHPEHMWVQPIADTRVIDVDGDPSDVVAARETIRLAFVAALQHLPPKQRAALILCEVLKWSAAETAELLETSVAAVNSALQRARATLDSVGSGPLDGEPLDPVSHPDHEDLLRRYVDAFERYDMDALVRLLHHDAVISMPPNDLWLQGADQVIGWMVGPGIGCRGSWLVPLEVNGTAGFASYKPGPSGAQEAWAIQVIDVRHGRITGHHNFLGTRLFEEFGLPLTLVER
jgi:RNA polymerase sigma-70 factor, ECF subfamily